MTLDLRIGATLTGQRPAPARLVFTDPPWIYSQAVGAKLAADHYAGLSTAEAAEHVRAAAEWAAPGARMVLWCTFPLLAEWMSQDAGPWHYKTGGAWLKQGGIGQGYHWRGDAEIALVYVRRGAGAGRPHETIRNGHASPRGRHSVKPDGWQRAMIRAWTEPGDHVLDLFAGLGSVAAAARAEGRRYTGWEIDPVRHAAALVALRAAGVP